MSTSVRAALAAGLLQGAGTLDRATTTASAAAALVEVLGPNTLWQRADDLAASVETIPTDPAAAWVPAPTGLPSATLAALDGAMSEILDAAVTAALAGPRDPIMRLTVRNRDQLAALDTVLSGGLSVGAFTPRVVPLLFGSALHFAWRWPLRVGVIAGPRTAEWATSMSASAHHGSLYDVVADPPAGELDILVVDGSLPDGAESERHSPGDVACVIVVGAGPTGDALRDRAAAGLRPAISAGVMAPDAGWFVSFVYELSHDQPVDVALALTAPAVRLAGDPASVTLTAVGRWAAAIAVEHKAGDREPAVAPSPGILPRPGHTVGDDESGDDSVVSRDVEFVLDEPTTASPTSGVTRELAVLVNHGDFSRESYAASIVSAATRSLVGTSDELVLERRFAMAGPPTEEPPRDEITSPARRLLADITAAGELQERTLRPDTDHLLEVQIAVPDRPDQGVAFSEHAVPDAHDGVAHLTVMVTCDELGLAAEQPLDLPTSDRTRDSSVAAFAFHTGPDGAPLTFRVVVLHQNRPIQAVVVMATVRATPTRRDRVQLLAVPLTAIPEPLPEATPAQVTLQVGADGVLRSRQSGGEVAAQQGTVRDLLDRIEQRASAALAGGEPIVFVPGSRAPKLLVDLARLGSKLHEQLHSVDDPTARTISLIGSYDAPILPLELAYAGPTPRDDAKLCRLVTDDAGHSDDGPCRNASKGIVCPFAFWGLFRTVARVVAGAPTPTPRPVTYGALRLQPALFAAAERADHDQRGTPADALPSAVLRTALADAIGTAVEPVTSWRAWRKEVSSRHPQLLVTLAHTETIDGEATIEIGRRSTLAQPDIDASFVVGDGSVAPLVMLMACASGVVGDSVFGALPASFAASGAAAVIATLSKLRGPDGATAAAAVVAALTSSVPDEGITLGAALTNARRTLLRSGSLIGLLLVGAGEIDVRIERARP